MPSNILLINPKHPFSLSSPPLGLGYITAYARQMKDHSVIIFDENFIENPDREILSIIRHRKIDFVGIGFPSSAVLRVVEICKLIRAHYDKEEILLFAGGYHPTSEPELTLRLIPQLDFVVVGEGEQAVSELDYNWSALDNVAFIKGDRFIQNPVTNIKNIDEIPFPSRAEYDPLYYKPAHGVIAGIYGKVATIMTSRGCPYSCNFCSSKLIQKHIRYHSTSYVLTEIEHILGTLGDIDYLYFLDVMFLAKWQRVEELCREMIRLRFHKRFRWAATVAANVVDDTKVRLMKEAGCFYLSFGFESNSADVLRIINKKATPEDNQRACDVCKRLGIYVNSAFLFGIPGETTADLQESIDFVRTNRIQFTGVNIMKPLPGSPFYYEFVSRGIISPSIKTWHEISSIHVAGKIYNDQITEQQYTHYVGRFNRVIAVRSIISNIHANWRTALKYIIKQRLRRIVDTVNFQEMPPEEYKKQTQANWTAAPCGSNTSDKEIMSRGFFEDVEGYRYGTHPWILDNIKRFDLKGKKVLEIGFGMGTDHIAMAKEGGIMHGIDLTPQNLVVTKKRFELSGLTSSLTIGDAEKLPFEKNSFDFVYSFGVIHHSPDTQKIISEIYRVLKPGGKCWVAVYHKNSLFFWWSIFLIDWLMKGGFRKESLKQRISRIEYPNDNPNLVIRLYKKNEFAGMFYLFDDVKAYVDHLIKEDVTLLGNLIPRRVLNYLAGRYGWYVIVEASK